MMSVDSLEFIEVFYSYAQRDEELRNELEKHLGALKRLQLIRDWHHRDIQVGTDWMQTVNVHLDSAHIILLLISADFINSDYCYSVEMQRALERHKQGKARVVPILLRPVDLEGTPIASLRALPTSGKPITSWSNRDEAFTDVSKGIRKVIQELKAGSPATPLFLTKKDESKQISPNTEKTANGTKTDYSIIPGREDEKRDINILAIFACPPGTNRPYIDREERTIREAIELSRNQRHVTLRTYPAATIRDLNRALLNDTFQILHIASPGSSQGLILVNESGGRFFVDQQTLVELLEEYSSSLQCIILNACYSSAQGSPLSRIVPFTIVMEADLNSNAAIEFSKGFYDALCAGKSIDFAFRNGCRSIQFQLSRSAKLPKLLKQTESAEEESPKTANSELEEIAETFHFKDERALIGIALDLSASMRKSTRNNTQGQISHLERVRKSLHELAKTAQRSIRESKNEQSSIDMFIYGFGLQTMRTCDLLSLIKASRQIVTKDIIEDFKKEYQQEKREKFKGYTGLGKLLKDWGLSNQVEIVEEFIQQQSERTIRKRIFHQWKEEIEKRAQEIGDTTLPLDEIAEWWDTSEDVLGSADDFIFGSTTPITAALETAINRFEQETRKRGEKHKLILFLVSDGKFSNPAPLLLATQLRTMGVTIFSCLVTNIDSANPRELRHDPLPEWVSGAKVMFEMASQLEPGTEMERFLLRKGWTIYPGPKLFVQVNHSDVLKEFIRVTLSELEDSDDNEMLPRGW